MACILILVRKSEHEFRGRSLSFPLLGAAAEMPGAEGLLVLSLGVRFEDAADGSFFGCSAAMTAVNSRKSAVARRKV
jgi:hypothetical protein